MCTPKGVCLCWQHRDPLYCILKLAGSKKAELRVAGARERGLPAHCRTAGSSPRSQLPRTGWELQASARLPRPSWRWARESGRSGRYTSEKTAKNNVWAYIKKALGDTKRWHTQGKLNLLAGEKHQGQFLQFFSQRTKQSFQIIIGYVSHFIFYEAVEHTTK